MRERDDRREPAAPKAWPSVVAVVPARNEADVIATSIGSLIGQDYPGDFRIILVDDNSDDGTAAAPDGHRGHGIDGMRERAALHHGNLSAGPAPDGGWLVLAVLRLDSQVQAVAP